jgi:mono/diheme cytochrome c family protein
MDGEMAEGDGGGSGEASHLAGEGIYKAKCVLCHGAGGKGDGVGAAALNPAPRDHTDGAYMNDRTNAQLLEVIKDGKGQMTPWGSILSDEEMHQVLAYVRTLAEPAYSGPMP